MPVVDANLLVVLASGDLRRTLVLRQISEWLDDGVELHAYIELAESLSADLWTLDGPLYRKATGCGFAVRLIQ